MSKIFHLRSKIFNLQSDFKGQENDNYEQN